MIATCFNSQATEDDGAQSLLAGGGPLDLCAEVALASPCEGDSRGLIEHLVRAIEKHLDAVAAGCWLLDRAGTMLQPVFRVGCPLPFEGLQSPVPVGKTIIG